MNYECVLKDVWIERDAQTESQIQAFLFAAIENFWSKVPPSHDGLAELRTMRADLVVSKRYKDSFLTIKTDHVGEPSCAIADETVPIRGPFDPRVTVGTRAPHGYIHRKHYRVIFQERCTPVGDLGPLGNVVDVLSQVLTRACQDL